MTYSQNGDSVTIGNDAISRTFSVAGGTLKTTEIHNKRASTKLSLAEGDSEEFIIKRTKKDGRVQQPIDQTGWTAEADSEEKFGEGAGNGLAECLIDNNNGTIWHSQYKDSADHKLPTPPNYPHFVTISMPNATSFKSFSYDPRQQGANGNIKGYELYVSTQEARPAIPVDNAAFADVEADDAVDNAALAGAEADAAADKSDSAKTLSDSDQAVASGSGYAGWTQVAKGEFDYNGSDYGPIHVNIEGDKQASCENVRHVMLVATSAVKTGDGSAFAGGEEFDLYAEPWVEVQGDNPMLLKSSQLELDGEPVVADTNPTINKQQKTGKKLSFKFKPVVFNGAEYTITENYVMYNGDHYMRKFLEISVPEEDALDAEIDYIDLESIDMKNAKSTWTIPTDKGGVVKMNAQRANLGQPIYADGMFFGCEFPVADTQIEQDTKVGRSRYYSGKTMGRLVKDEQAQSRDHVIRYNTWQTVAGAARGVDMGVVQADFFDYIDDISVPSEFRIQYNSWFDNMQNITDENILKSYIEIDRELNNAEVRPLDSWVVDDGWQNISPNNTDGVWTFNEKFPNGFGPSSQLARDFGSDFGVWIGPRGGYPSADDMADALVLQNKGVKVDGSIDVADRTYLAEYANTVCKYQNDYHVNYWKWDGFARNEQFEVWAENDGVPGRSTAGPTEGHMIGGKSRMYHVSDMWEAWIDLFEKVRANGEANRIDDLWISLTTYTNPSPWFLQWANSVWLQCTPDQAGAGISPNDKSDSLMDRQLDARDGAYYDFIKNHQFQFPLKHLYNHDPVYGKSGTGMSSDTATAEQFQNYLYTMAGRGTAFWELYYSDSILDEEKYEVNAEFLKWVESNFPLLENAKMIGDSPASFIRLDYPVSPDQKPNNTVEQYGNGTFGTYGYAGFNGDQGILTVRNADWKAAKELKFNFDDATLGVAGAGGDEFDYVVERHYTKNGAKSSVPETGKFTYGKDVSLTLQPEESLTIRVTKKGEGDKKAPSIETVRHNGVTEDGKTELVVRMDEKVKGEAKFTVNGKEIAADKVKRSADDVTYRITLDKAPKQGEKLDVKVSGITDMAGNKLTGDVSSVDFHKGNVVASRCPSRLTAYTKKLAPKADSLVAKTGISVFSQVNAKGHGPLVKQEGAYELGVDENGKAYFDFNGLRVTSRSLVNDGAKHTVAGTRENNGILKIYVDGALDGSKYDVKNVHHETPAGDILFAGGSFDKSADEASAAVYDRALGYNEIKAMHDKVIPDTSVKNLSKGKAVKAAWTDSDLNAAKGEDCPMDLAVNGDHSNSNAGYYGEFGTDREAKSSYMEIDLGDVHELTGMHLWRYWLTNGRTYKDTLIVTSVDDKFGSKDEDNSDDVIVFNADKKNIHGFGEGAEDGYVETKDGRPFSVPAGTKARYVRLYMNGRNDGNTNHVVEFEIMGRSLPSDPGAQIDTTKLYQRIDDIRAAVESGKWTPESVQKVMDKLEAAELVADCPKDEAQVAKAIEDLNGAEDLLKKAVTVTFAYKGDVPADAVAPAAVDVEQGSALGDKLPAPTAEGYIFAGWFMDEACASGNEFTSKTKVGADMTVFGKWVKDDGTVPPAPGPENPGPEQPEPEQPGNPKPEQPGDHEPSAKPNKPGKPVTGLPQTGDNSMLPIAVCGVAGVVLMAVALVIRKRRKA